MTSTKKTLRATFAAIAAATLTMTATPAVFAQETTTPAAPTTTQNDGELTIEGMPTEADLVVHKSTKDRGERGNGTKNTEFVNDEPVEGVKFTAYPITGFDTGKNADWRKISEAADVFNGMSAAQRNKAIEAGSFKFTPKGASAEETVNIDNQNGVTQSTLKDGTATFKKLPRGFYVVQETIPAKGVNVTINGETKDIAEAGVSLQGAMPFVVSVPMTDQNDTSNWLKTIHVYPKNSVTGIDKAVEDVKTPGAGSQADSAILYTVKTDIPKNYGNKEGKVVDGNKVFNYGPAELTSYQIVDKLSKFVNYTGTESITLAKVTGSEEETKKDILGVIEGDFTLVKDTDYKIEENGKYVSVVFTKAGREKLVAAQAANEPSSLKVVWKLNAQIDTLTMPEGDYRTLPNDAYLIPPNSYEDEGKWTPSKECVEITDPDGDNPGGDNPGGDNPGGDNPGGDNPGGDNPGGDNPGGDNPGGDNPGGGNPGGDTPGNGGGDQPGTPNEDTPKDPCTPPGPHVRVTSKYGAVKIIKVAKEDNSKTLKGAEFELFTCNDKGQKTDYTNDFVVSADAPKIKVNGQSKWGTDENGVINITGLELNDWNNADSEIDSSNGKRDATGKNYCLFETKAPTGYERLANPVKFQLLTGDSEAYKEVQIENVSGDAGFNLPLTGGKGVLPLIALGGLLVVGAGGYAAVAAKRNRKEA